MKFCKECGNSLADNMVFCSNCGTNVTLTEDADGKNHSEDFLEKQNTKGRNSIEETNIQILEQTAMAKEVKTPQKNPKKKVQAKYVVLAFFMVLIGVVGAVIANMDLPVTVEETTASIQTGDLTGTAHFSYCLLDTDTYNGLKQMGASPNSFTELPDIPWKDTTATVSGLSNFAVSDLLSMQGNQRQGKYTLTAMAFQTIANGSSNLNVMHTYKLAELYVNGKPAFANTYLNDGDKVQAVIVIS